MKHRLLYTFAHYRMSYVQLYKRNQPAALALRQLAPYCICQSLASVASPHQPAPTTRLRSVYVTACMLKLLEGCAAETAQQDEFGLRNKQFISDQ
jgi:hypothetical protein